MIIIRTVPNPALSQFLQEGLRSETRHRTPGGALRRLVALRRRAADWQRAVGNWGEVAVEVAGRPLDDFDFIDVMRVAEPVLRREDAADATAAARRVLERALVAARAA